MTLLTVAICALCFATTALTAQKYFTKSGNIEFVSDAPLEKITATNSQGSSVIDMSSGKIQWAVLVKAFKFEKALMEEHFNENYMESSEFPKAKFTGQILDHSSIDLNVDGEYPATVEGNLEIHGVVQKVSKKILFNVEKGEITGTSSFSVNLDDYDIEIPAVVAENLSKEVLISVNAKYQKLDK